MDEERFWALIEGAWRPLVDEAKARRKLAAGTLSEDKALALVEAAEEMIPILQAALAELPAEELMAFDRILERKLYDIDRAEIQEQTDGSDDGFLYARGFIVAAGKGYYDLVNSRPEAAITDLDCAAMCYMPWHLYFDKFGDMPPSGISRETCSNSAGWPGLG